MMSVMLRMTRASAGAPSVWRTPAIPHIRSVLPDWHGLDAGLQLWFGSDNPCVRRPVDGALILGQKSESRRQASENRHLSIVSKAAKEGHGQKYDQRSAQR